MANVEQLPTASTPTSSRRASRARRAASDQAQSNVATNETTDETASVERELPARTDETSTPPAASDAPVETGSTDRELPARDENGTTAAPAEAAKVEPTKLLILAAENPKRKGTQAFDFFQHYYGTGENKMLTTVEEAFGRGVRGKDLSWDRQRGHVIVGEEVDQYIALDNDDARREFLTKRGFSHKMAGLVVEAAKEEVKQAVETGQVEGSPVEAPKEAVAA